MKTIYLLACAASLMLLASTNSLAQSTSWKGTFNTYWSNTSNWTNGVPDSTKDAILGDANFTGIHSPKVNATSSCRSITVGGVRATTLALTRTLKVYANFNILPNAIVEHPSSTAYLAGNLVNNGIYRTSAVASRIIFNGTTQSISGDSVTIFRRITVNAGCTLSLNKNIRLDSTGSFLAVYGIVDPGAYNCYVFGVSRIYANGKLFVRAATFGSNYTFTGATTLYGGSIVEYNSASDQAISSTYFYSTLILAGGGTKSLTANLPLLYGKDATNGRILVQSGTTFDLQGFTANRATRAVGGELNLAAGATMKLSGLNNFPLNYGTRALNTVSTVEYNGVDQTISPQTYGNLLFSTAGIKTATLAFSTMGNLTMLNGTLNTNAIAVTHSVAGNFISTGGTFTGSAYTYQLNGTADQNVNLSTAVSRLRVDKPSGNLNLSSDLTVSNTLTFISSPIITNTYSVIIPTGGSIVGAGQLTGWVDGNLRKTISAGSGISRAFEVGDGSYSPVNLLFNNVSISGDLTAKATSADQPEIDYSGLDPAKSVNRYWSFTNAGVVFTNATSIFNWETGDIDGGANTAAFTAGMFNGSAWSLQSSSSPLASSIQANNLSTLAEFSVGETIDRSTWTGAAMTADWFTAKNWLGLIPAADKPTFIPNGLLAGRVYPVLTAGTGIVGDLTVENTATLTVSAGTISIAGALTSTGNVDATAGAVEFNGSSLQTVMTNSFSGNVIHELFVGNNVSLDDNTIVTGTLHVANNKTLYTNNNLVLRSSATGTARIAELPVDGSGNATAFIDGNVSIERFIPARKAWRLLGAPIKNGSATTLAATWQEGAYTPAFAPASNPNPGYGIHIAGGTSTNGFDQSATNFPTLKVFDNSINSFSALPTTPGTFVTPNAYSGYFVYIRGDRSIDLMQGDNAAVTSTTLRMKGTVHTGKVVSNVNAAGFTVLGNPYASAIDFAAITRNNVKNSFYIWDPKLAGTSGLGAYVTVSWNSGTSTYDVTTSASAISQYIPSGEAILIESQDGVSAGTLTITESCKTTSGSDELFGRSVSKNSELRINLYNAGNEGSSPLDAVLVTFNSAHSNSIDKDDIRKMFGESASINLLNNQKQLAIERRNTLNYKDLLNFELTQHNTGTYEIEFAAANCEIPGYEMILIDRFDESTNNTVLSSNDKTRVTIRISDNAASKSNDRFSVGFRRSGAGLFAVQTPQAPQAAIVVFPNPVRGNSITFKAFNLDAGMYQAQIFSSNGQLLTSYSFTHPGGKMVVSQPRQVTLPSGVYQLEVSNARTAFKTSFIKE